MGGDAAPRCMTLPPWGGGVEAVASGGDMLTIWPHWNFPSIER